jgi:hypothetical protein
MTFIIILKIILHNINFVKIVVVGPKTKIDTRNQMYHAFGIILLYYYNIKHKSVPKGVIVVCFHSFTPYYKISTLKIIWLEKKYKTQNMNSILMVNNEED